MIETALSVKAKDGHMIYGRLNQSAAQKSDRLLIIVHGLTSHIHAHHHVETMKRFTSLGYDVIRISLYGPEPDARKLEGTSLAIHASDVHDVLAYARTLGYGRLYLVGHSYGGATLLLANADVTAQVLWDSTVNAHSFWTPQGKPDGQGGCTVNWGMTIQIGQAMYEEGMAFNTEYGQAHAARLVAPSLVLNAESSLEDIEYQHLFEALNCQKRQVVIEDADHCFTWPGNLDKALDAMQDWFKAYP